jgi:predicted metal-dependent hydrolase
MDINAVVAERFYKWGDRFRAERAIPFLALGVNIADGTIMVTVPEGLDRSEIKEALQAALTLIEKGAVDEIVCAIEPEARGDLHR